MAPNLARRAALSDAGIRVLAERGARGLTHRAVDAEAGVPIGTSSNYFRSRDALLRSVAQRIFQRLSPDEPRPEDIPDAPPSRDENVRVIREIVRGVVGDPDVYIALLELRLEAIRRPSLRAALSETIRRNLDTDVQYHVASGLPGGRDEVVLLHLAIDGLIFDQLTLPGALGIDDVDRLVGRIVDRLVLNAA